MGRYEEYIKGGATNEFPDDYVVIDIETTGLNPVKDHIIEISALRYRANRKVDEFVTLVAPGVIIPDFITRLTGITDDMLQHAPNVAEAAGDFMDFIGDDIIVGYNVTFDLAFLNEAVSVHLLKNIFNKYIDVMQIAMDKLPFLGRAKQTVVAKYFGLNTEGSHRAFTDCEICNGCYQKLKELSVPMYNMPVRQIMLTATDDAVTSKPLNGKKILFKGILFKWYLKNLQHVIKELGGIICYENTDVVDIVIVGTADKAVLESKEFMRLLELKEAGAEFALMKDASFIRGLTARGFLRAL